MWVKSWEIFSKNREWKEGALRAISLYIKAILCPYEDNFNKDTT